MSPSDTTTRFRSILVPVDGTEASLRAVALACDIARRNDGRVYVVHVIEVKRTLPLDAELYPEEAGGDEMLTEAGRVAKEAGCAVEGDILHARDAGPAIVDEAIERGADLVILGTAYDQPFGEFQLGRVIQYVLKAAPCDVWVCRHPAQE